MLRIENLAIRIGEKEIISDVNLQLADSGWTSIIGPNGSGKSTLLKAMLGVLPYSGNILETKNGVAVEVYRNRKRNVAYIPQRPSLPIGMLVSEYVALSSLKSKKLMVNQVLTELGIYGLRDQVLSTLSGGELQLVTLARAVAQEPEMILLDEPTAALDLHHQMRTLNFIDRLKLKGIRIISVMHDLSTVGLYCDDLALLNKGRLLIHGTAEEVLYSPLLAQSYEYAIDIFKLESGRSIIISKEP